MKKLLEGCTILFVCSERITSSVISTCLTNYGGKAVTISRLAELAESILLNNFDIIVVDLRLSGESGLEALTQLRTLDNGSDIPVLMVAPEDVSDRHLCVQRSLDHGATDIIFKPFDETSLVLKLRLLMLLRGSCRSSDERVRRWIAAVQPSIDSIHAVILDALGGRFGEAMTPELLEGFKTIRLQCDRLAEAAAEAQGAKGA